MSTDLPSTDVAIVGGGIVGCAIALAVRRRLPPLPPDLTGAADLTEEKLVKLATRDSMIGVGLARWQSQIA